MATGITFKLMSNFRDRTSVVLVILHEEQTAFYTHTPSYDSNL